MTKIEMCLAMVDNSIKESYKAVMGRELKEDTLSKYIETLYSRYSSDPIEFASSLPSEVLSNDLNNTINMEIWCHS